MNTDYETLKYTLEAVLDLHRPFPVYDECECVNKDAPGHREILDIGMTCNYQYSVCSECCTDGDYMLEECAYSHDHGHLNDYACETNRIIAEGLKK